MTKAREGRFTGAIRKYRHLIFYIVLINLCIIAIGYILHTTGNAESLSRKLDAAQEGFLVFGVVRCILEVIIFFNWRCFVGWCRRTFKLGYRKTWFVYQCRTLWKMFMIFDVGTFLLVNLN